MESIISNNRMKVEFSDSPFGLTAIENLLTGERYRIEGDTFLIETDSLAINSVHCKIIDVSKEENSIRARYQHEGFNIDVTYTLRIHFLEKRISLQAHRTYTLHNVAVSSPHFSYEKLLLIAPYRYQHNVTYFGRTPLGGFFTGVQIPFDTSVLEGDRITLRYRPAVKVKSGEIVECEPVYFGVYKRNAKEGDVSAVLTDGNFRHLPLRSESDAMIDVVSEILGPPRHGPTSVLSPSCCGGIHLNSTDESWFDSEEKLSMTKRILDFAKECGVEFIHDYLPWGGEFKNINSITGEKSPESCAWLAGLLKYTRDLGLKPIIWSTFNNVNPWAHGRSFRPDKPEWMATLPSGPSQSIGAAPDANCMGKYEYQEWLTNFVLDRMDKNNYHGFSIDGDFSGNGGWFSTSCVPLRCLADSHDHLPGEAQYSCERVMFRHLAGIRKRYPNAFLWLMRPMMDLGVWTYRNGDAVFTILEDAAVKNLTGIKEQPKNVTFADKIRIWARIRRDHHFCPHYLDQAQLFPGFDGGGGCLYPWDGDKLDYLMISSISTTPNQCFFTGPVDNIPTQDRAMIRRWLDWSRANAKYLMKRKDLPDWPSMGKIDGSAHIVDNTGFVFLFNPNPTSITGQFNLSYEDIGLCGNKSYQVSQQYPESGKQLALSYGETVNWEIPAMSAVILGIKP